jgi:hypothetical protein
VVKLYRRGDIFDFPRKKRRISWYVEILCLRLLQLDQINQDNVRSFWNEIKKKEEKLPFPWQRENLREEAKKGLNELLCYYAYDPKNRVYERTSKPLSDHD